MDMLCHSMELHPHFRDTPWNFRAFHGTPSILHGTPWILHGTPRVLHGYSMEVMGYFTWGIKNCTLGRKIAAKKMHSLEEKFNNVCN